MKAISQLGDRAPSNATLAKMEGAFGEGSLDLAFWNDTQLGRMRFVSTLEDPQLLTGVGDSPPVEVGPGRWYFDDANGKRAQIHIADGWVDVTHEGVPEGEASIPSAFLSLPAEILERPGCTIFVDTSQAATSLTRGQLLFHLPFQVGTGVYFAFVSPTLSEVTEIPAPALRPALVQTEAAPDLLLVLGMGVADLKLDGVLKGEERKKFLRFHRIFPVADGTVVGAMLGKPLRVGAVIPMERPIPGPVLARRLKRVAVELDFPHQVLDATHLRVLVKDKYLEFSFAPGQVMMATDVPMLYQMEQGNGAPWVSGQTAQLAAEFPLVFTASRLVGKEGEEEMVFPNPLSFSLGMRDGVIQGYLVLPLKPEQLQQLLESTKAALPGLAP